LPRATLAKRVWKLTFLAIAFFYLFGLGALPLLGPDEPRYAEVGREMLTRQDLITPTLGGYPWFEKPALLYWLMIASYRVLGVTEYAARLGPAICGLLTAAFVFWLGRSVARTSAVTEPERTSYLGEWSALVFLSSFGAIAFSRAASFDIVLTMTVTGALCCFFIWHIANKDRQRRSWLLVGFYFCVGLSLLAKGLVGIVLPIGIIAVYFVLRRESPTRSFRLSLLWGLPFALIVATCWYGPMIYRHGGTFIDQFIVQHHFARFLSNKYHHPQPFYFYVPVMLLMALPWTVVLLAGFASSRRWSWRGRGAVDLMRVFALAWVVVPLVFFSLSKSKIPGYILPALPAAALLIGERISFFLHVNRGTTGDSTDGCSAFARSCGRCVVLSAGGRRARMVDKYRSRRRRSRCDYRDDRSSAAHRLSAIRGDSICCLPLRVEACCLGCKPRFSSRFNPNS
jgi:4-amino-4-deoxy-L-arabinose transferase-like glycosyltransferase